MQDTVVDIRTPSGAVAANVERRLRLEPGRFELTVLAFADRGIEMPGVKVKVPYEVMADQHTMLQTIAERYSLPDASKALRCLLDYAATDGDWEEIFARVRCRRCG